MLVLLIERDYMINVRGYALPEGETLGIRCEGGARAPRAPDILLEEEDRNPALSTKLFFGCA